MTIRPARLRGLAVALSLTALAGCSNHRPSPSPAAATNGVAPAAPTPSVPALTAGRLRADLIVTGPLTSTEVRKVAALVPGTVAYATGTVRIGKATVRVASVDPLTFRRWTSAGTAESTAIWQTLAAGQLVASHEMAKQLKLTLGQDVALKTRIPTSLRLGGLATTGIPGTDLLVDKVTGISLGITKGTALLLNAGKADPTTLAKRVRSVTGVDAVVELLSPPAASPIAFLTGSRAAKAFGAFSYKYYSDGTIVPDARWVRNYIVSATVPIFGTVTCHRLMIPQLRAALREVQAAGLASSLHTYNGCYVPRFIERDPSHAISLHTWGIAIDLDAATNYRGIRGTMDPRVVQIFKKWGFRWGGDWSYSDPMHFELGALLKS